VCVGSVASLSAAPAVRNSARTCVWALCCSSPAVSTALALLTCGGGRLRLERRQAVTAHHQVQAEQRGLPQYAAGHCGSAQASVQPLLQRRAPVAAELPACPHARGPQAAVPGAAGGARAFFPSASGRALAARQVVVKSQILAGGRGLGRFTNGLQGGVHICKVADAPELASKMLGGTLVPARGRLCPPARARAWPGFRSRRSAPGPRSMSCTTLSIAPCQAPPMPCQAQTAACAWSRR